MKSSEKLIESCGNCAFCNVAFYEPPCSLCGKPDNKWTPVSFTEIENKRTCDKVEMKIRIIKQGHLIFKRKNTWTPQICPYGSNVEDEIPCGDWCPMFGEPVFNNSMVCLQLCQVKVNVNVANFEDLRC